MNTDVIQEAQVFLAQLSSVQEEEILSGLWISEDWMREEFSAHIVQSAPDRLIKGEPVNQIGADVLMEDEVSGGPSG